MLGTPVRMPIHGTNLSAMCEERQIRSCKDVERAPAVDSSLAQLNETSHSLVSLVEVLRSRLGPVLRDEPRADRTGPGCQSGHSCPLSRSLSEVNANFRVSHDALAEILELLELQ